MKSFREGVISYSILLIVFILPLIVVNSLSFPYISPKTFFFYGVVDLAFVFWLYSLIVDKSYRLSRKQVLFFIPVFLYIVWMSFSSLFAVNPSLSFWGPIERGTGLLTLYHAFIFSLIVSSLIKRDSKKYLNKLLKYFLWGSFILAISVWLGDEGFNLPFDTFTKSSGGGFTGNSSFTAAYLIFSIFFCLYFLFEKSISKSWKVFTSVILITIVTSPLFFNLHGLTIGKGILGSARGAFLGIFVGLGFVFLFYLALSKKRILKILGIIGIFISIAIFSFSWYQLMKPDTYLHNKFIEVASENRFIFWDVAKKAMHEHPYFGYGPENYMIAFRENFDVNILNSNRVEAWSDKAHNIYFDTGVSGGYPAIAFYSIFILSIFYAIYQAYKIDKLSQIQAGLLGGLLIAYIFQDLFVFDSPVSTVALFMTFGVLIALQSGAEVNKKLSHVKIDAYILNFIVIFLSISFVIAFINLSYLPLKKSRDFTRVTLLNIDKRPKEYMSLLEGSKVGNYSDASFFAYQMNSGYSKNIKNLQQDKNILSYVDADLTAYLAYLNKLAETNKTDYRLYLSMLHLYDIKINILGEKYNQEEFNHILSIIDYAHSLSPRDPQVYWDAGFLKMFQGDFNSALIEYRNAVYLDKTVKPSWEIMLKFLKMTNQQKMYDVTIKEAQKNIPGFEYQPF